jgi:RNA polymerase sigma-70 factor (ECF subfamily)
VTISLPGCTDGELAALARSGRQAAFTELIHRHQSWAYRLVRSHIGDADEAVDVVQASFVAAFAALDRYDTARSFPAWLSRIAINKCRDWRRRRAVRKLFTFARPLDEAHGIAHDVPPVDRIIDSQAELARTMKAIASLPAALKEPLILRTIEGRSEAETAEILGVSPKAVETRLYRARIRLGEILRKS